MHTNTLFILRCLVSWRLFFSSLSLVSFMFFNLEPVSAKFPEKSLSVASTNSAYYVLYSISNKLYALAPNSQTPISLSNEFPIPQDLIVDLTTEILNPQEWPNDIVVSEEYSFVQGLVAPSGDKLIYVESLCDHDHCSFQFNTWLVDTNTHDRKLLLSNLGEMKGLLPSPIAWNEKEDFIVFDTFNIEGNSPFG